VAHLPFQDNCRELDEAGQADNMAEDKQPGKVLRPPVVGQAPELLGPGPAAEDHDGDGHGAAELGQEVSLANQNGPPFFVRVERSGIKPQTEPDHFRQQQHHQTDPTKPGERCGGVVWGTVLQGASHQVVDLTPAEPIRQEEGTAEQQP
jgi:hypothetical protein